MKLRFYIISLLFLCFSSISYSGVIIVTDGSTSGPGTLRDAIDSANPSDTVIISITGTIGLSSPIPIDSKSNLTIIGPYPKHISFIAEGASVPNIFEITNNSSVTIKGIAFKHVFDPTFAVRAASIDNGSSVTFEDCLFEGCQPENVKGGAISVTGGSKISVSNCSFFNNKSTDDGGAIYFDASNNQAAFFNNTFFGNQSDSSGGAILIDSVQTSIESYVFYNNTFKENIADTLSGDPGHAIWFNIANNSNFFTGSRAIVFINNIFAENFNTNYLDQSQIYANNGFASLNYNIWASHNYYQFASASESILQNFTANAANDYNGEYLLTDLHLRDNPVEDGYGLKYFPINDNSSPLINTGDNTPSYFTLININFSTALKVNDQRRAPRIIEGTADIGAVEYTPYRLTGSPNATAWWNLITSINSSTTPTDVHYIEFDLTNPTTGARIHQSTPPIDRTIYIDGYSQDGSVIPGPNNVSFFFTTSDDTLTSARDLVTLYNQGSATNGIDLNMAPNSTIAGVSLIDFDEYGINIETNSDSTTIFGSVIGAVSNVGKGLPAPNDGNGFGGVLIKATDVTIGGEFHHERNVIVDNGFNTSYGANIKLESTATNITIAGNVVGLHPDGNDTIPIQFNNTSFSANGIYADAGANIAIGGNYLFGKNTISNHRGNGIFHEGVSGGNILIDNNNIGTSFDGKTGFGNKNGIVVNKTDNGYVIGGSSGNIISANDSVGIFINSGNDVIIQGNTIGGDSVLLANNFGNETGILIEGTSGQNTNPNTIGGDDYNLNSERNIIVNNTKAGIRLSGEDVQFTTIQGNLIGVASDTSTSALPNVIGIQLDSGAHDNYIGYDGVSGNLRQINIISGNSQSGILLDQKKLKDNRVASNLIGGTYPNNPGDPLNDVGNKNGIEVSVIEDNANNNIIGNESDNDLQLVIVGNDVGIRLDSSSNIPILNCRIGIDSSNNDVGNGIGILSIETGTLAVGGAGTKSNIISGNDSIGIYLYYSESADIEGNLIGTDDSGTNPVGNRTGIKIKGGEQHEIGKTELNVISGNYYGIVMDSTITATVRNNYFGLSADGMSAVSGSYYGLVGRDLNTSNIIGLDNTGAEMKNYFATDSVDIGITSSREQKIRNNVMGYAVDGTTAVNGSNKGIGIRLSNSKFMQIGDNTTFGNNTIANKAGGLVLISVDSSSIVNNRFGTDVTGSAISNTDNQRYGIINRSGASNTNKIGPNNVFGGNRVGLILSAGSSDNYVFGNFFGIDTALNSPPAAFENDTAIYFNNATKNFVGLSGSDRNEITNYNNGIVLTNGSDTNIFTNNYIGVVSNGNNGSNLGSGVVIDNSNMNTFGSSNLADRNIISKNNGRGIDLINGSVGNSLLRNSIFDNNSLGIDIEADNIPDSLGVATVQNGIQTPVLNSVFPCPGSAEIRLELILNGLTPGEDYFVDLYENSSVLDPSGFGEGENSIYFDTITAANANDTILIDLTAAGLTGLSIGDNLTAILTSESSSSSSEFGRNEAIKAAPVNPTVTDFQEICRNGKGGSIEVDNSANSIYDYEVLLGPSSIIMDTTTNSNLFEEDSLAPNNYSITVNYSNGCSTSDAVLLNTGPSYEVQTTVVNDTCSTNTGQVTLDTIMYNISGVINTLSYSIDNGSSFSPSPVFSNQGAGTINPIMSIEVTNGGSTDNCPSTNNMSVDISNDTLTTELAFGYNDFCVGDGGVVAPLPTFTSGSYSLINLSGSGTINASSGAISGETDNAVYNVIYMYNIPACSDTVFNVTAHDVPDPSFVFADFFCSSVDTMKPVSYNTSATLGEFSVFSQPVGEAAAIVVGNGDVSNPNPEFLPGEYVIEFDTKDPQCPRTTTDTILIRETPDMTSISVSNGHIENDTIEFCPTTVGNAVTAINANADTLTTWLDDLGNNITNATYSPAAVNTPNSFYLLEYFNEINYAGEIICTSTRDTSFIRVYDTPIDPVILNGDQSYCDGESVDTLKVADRVNWYFNNTNNQVLVDTNSYFAPLTNNILHTIYAQDSTGVACLSQFVATEVIVVNRPSTPEINYLTNTLNTIDSLRICPTSVDTIFALNAHPDSTFWGLVGGAYIDTTDKFVSSFLAGTSHNLFYQKDTTYSINFISGTADQSCLSDSGFVKVQVNDSVRQPDILQDTIAYCFGETVEPVYNSDSLVTNNVLWYENDINDQTFLATPLDSHIFINPMYDNTGIGFYTYARDSTGLNCYSAFDSVLVYFHAIPDLPILKLNIDANPSISAYDTVVFCPNTGELDKIIANTGSFANTNTIWEIIAGNTDTLVEYNIQTLAGNLDTLVYSRDTLYASSSGRYCRSERDTAYLKVLLQPQTISLTDAAYCENETVLDLTTNIGKDLIWRSSLNNDTTRTDSPHIFTPSPPSNYTFQADTITVYDSTGVTTLDNQCLSPVTTALIGYHGKPDTAIVRLLSTGDPAFDTTYICPGSVESFSVNPYVPSVTESFWRLNLTGIFVSGSTFDIDNFTANSNATVYNYRDTTATVVSGISKTCNSDTNSRIVHTFDAPVAPALTTSDTAYCEGETINSLEISNGTEIIWTEDGSTTSTIGAPHNYLQSIPPIYSNQVDTIIFQNITGVDQLGNECKSDEDTVRIAYQIKPDFPVLTLQSTMTSPPDTIFICPRFEDSLLADTPQNQSVWYTDINSKNEDSIAGLNIFGDNTDTTIFWYNTLTPSLTISKTCNSDTVSQIVHTYFTPVEPTLAADTSYCDEEIIIPNNVLNSPDVHTIIWGDDFAGNPRVIQDNAPFTYSTPNISYNNFLVEVYAIDSTGGGCYSDTGFVSNSFHSLPASPDVFLNASLTALNSGDTVNICPNNQDSLVTNTASSLTFFESTIGDENNSIYNISLASTNLIAPVKYRVGEMFNLVDNITCFSKFDSVYVNIYTLPVTPVILSGTLNQDTINYCEVDMVNNLSLLDPSNAVNWFQPVVVGSDSTLVNTYTITPPTPNYAGELQTIVAIDITGSDVSDGDPVCQSEPDTMWIFFNETPDAPIITPIDTSFCESEVLDTLFSNVVSDWFIGGTSGAPDQSGVSEFALDDYTFLAISDTVQYFARTISAKGCESSFSQAEVRYHPIPDAPIIAPMQTNYCSDEVVDTVKIDSGLNGFWYESSDLTNEILSNSDFYLTSNTIIDSIQYFVRVFDPSTECFSVYDSITLLQYISLGSITNDETIELCIGYSETLEATGGESYLWSSGETDSSITVSPSEDTWYKVEIIDTNNCSKVDSVQVSLKLPASCEETIYTAFSPNGDGVNETWEITGIEKFTNVSVYIFNRWGDQIARIDDYDNTINVWDGTNQMTGQISISGTYYYIIEENGNKVKDGWVQLMK